MVLIVAVISIRQATKNINNDKKEHLQTPSVDGKSSDLILGGYWQYIVPFFGCLLILVSLLAYYLVCHIFRGMQIEFFRGMQIEWLQEQLLVGNIFAWQRASCWSSNLRAYERKIVLSKKNEFIDSYIYSMCWSLSKDLAPYQYYVLALPRPHRINILWHCLIGHELFHT